MSGTHHLSRGWARGWRFAGRLARREARRRPGRSALVAGLVAVPVAAMLFAAGALRADELTSEEQWIFESGRADGTVMEAQPGELPAGSRVVSFALGDDKVVTGAGAACVCWVSDVPLADPITEGIAKVIAGRAPTTDGEVLVSPAAAHLLEVDLGERVELTAPIEGPVTVVGIGWLRGGPSDAPTVVLPPGSTAPGVGYRWYPAKYLVDLPDGATREEVVELFSRPGHPLTPAPWIEGVWAPTSTIGNRDMGVRWSLVGGAVGLTVLGIVIAAAFAVGASRQMVTLGQLAANGAEPATLRRVLFLQGTVTGVVGTAVGLGVGAVALHLGRPWLVGQMGHDLAGWHLRWNDVVAIAVLGVAASTLSALAPAFSATRVPVLSALAGRRPPGRAPRWLGLAGLAACTCGLGLMTLAVAITRYPAREGLGEGVWPLVFAAGGAVMLPLGVCTVAPVYVAVLGRAAAVLRGPWRLAARSLSRQRDRTSAVVAALSVTSAVAIATAALLVGTTHEVDIDRWDEPPADVVRLDVMSSHETPISSPAGRRPPAEAERRIAHALPGSTRHQLSTVVVPGQPAVHFAGAGSRQGDDVVVADRALIEAYRLSADTQGILTEAGVVAIGEREGSTQLLAWAPGADEPLWSSDGVVLGSGRAIDLRGAGTLFVTPERARHLGLDVVPASLVFRSPSPLSASQRIKLEEIQQAVAREPIEIDREVATTSLDFYRPDAYPEPTSTEAATAGAALLLALFVVASTLGLSAVESRDERDVLAAVGAGPATLRRTGARKAVLLTVLGGTLAVPVGYLPVLLLSRLGGGEGLPVSFPWRTAAVATVGVPLVAGLASTVAGHISQRRGTVALSTLGIE